MEKRGKRITLDDIARSIGVSRGTVDRAIHQRGRINRRTRERVIEAARNLGYVDEKLSSLLSLRRAVKTALIMPCRPEHFFDTVLSGAKQAAAEQRDPVLELAIYRVPEDGDAPQAEIIASLPRDIDALIIVPRGMEAVGNAIAKWKKAAENRTKPLITVNSDLPRSGRECFIGQDLFTSGRIAGELLGKMVRKGKILIVTGKKGLHGHEERIRGFLSFIEQFFPGIQAPEPIECLDREAIAEREVLLSIDGAFPPQGILCVSGASTIGAARALKQSKRTDIPLVGYDRNSELLEGLESLAVDALLTQDPMAQGREAVALVHSLAEGNAPPPGGFLYTPTEILFRELLRLTPEP